MSMGESPANRLTGLGQVLGPASGERIFDQEQFTRELLLSKLSAFLKSIYFDVCPLEGMRRLLGDIFLEPVASGRVPEDLRSMHCVKYRELSPVNRRRIIDLTFQYIGLTDARAEYALTKDGWASVKALAEKLCVGDEVVSAVVVDAADPPPSDGMTAVSGPDAQWSREVVASTLKSILTGSYFDICQVDTAAIALNSLRAVVGLPETRCAKHAGYVGLRALHCRDFKDMESAMAIRIPGMVLSVLGLSSGNGAGDGEAVLGHALWADVRLAYDAGIRVISSDPAAQPPSRLRASFWASFLAAFRRLVG